MKRTSLRTSLFAASTAGAVITGAACGKDVDIGGTSDAASELPSAPSPEAGLSQPCDPCESTGECVAGVVCARAFGADGFCLTQCPKGTACDGDDTCNVMPTVAGPAVAVCVPNAGACAPAPPPPPEADGAPLERCGEIVGPAISASCHSCEKSSPTCQANGCYGGWWCDTDSRRCEKPPTCK